MSYADFLAAKRQMGGEYGFDPLWMPDQLFDFQCSLVEWACRKGRAAIFANCGLGKTVCQLTWAENVVRKTGGKVLVLAPLAVSRQTVHEGEKFGIEVVRSQDGAVTSPITVTNYERLDRFNATDFVGVVADECFVAGTPVDTPMGPRPIETIKVGDAVFNASGIDCVVAVKKRKARKIVVVHAKERCIMSSENHPFLTTRGWVPAKELRSSDELVSTKSAMRMVRQGLRGSCEQSKVLHEIMCPEMATFRSCKLEEIGVASCKTMRMVRNNVYSASELHQKAILQSLLLGTMENESARDQGVGAYEGGSREDRKESSQVAERYSRGKGKCSTVCKHQTYEHSRDARTGFKNTSRDGAPPARSRRERTWTYAPRANATRCIGRVMAMELSGGYEGFARSGSAEISAMLQDRRCESGSESRDRSRWSFSLQQEGQRREERCCAGEVGVDSVEILESNDPRLAAYRDREGQVNLYDLQLAEHPSFSVHGLLVHNSSIFKNFDGQTRKRAIEFMRRLPYRLCCTATAAPNDYDELGNHAEALGEMGHLDMLGRFFVNDQNNRIASRSTRFTVKARWRLKGHAEEPFWRWVCSWARALRMPSDLGFDDGPFILPPLKEQQHLVKAKILKPGWIFDVPAVGIREQREERRRTLSERCDKIAELVAGHDMSLVWCDLNAESTYLAKVIPGAVEVKGSDSDEYKEEMLTAFAEGQAKRLITKARIGCHGLNLQKCAHVTFFPSHSWEQFFQGVRRCWRFGQIRPVIVDIVTTEGEVAVLENLKRKANQADVMSENLVTHMRNALKIERKDGEYPVSTEVPRWL